MGLESKWEVENPEEKCGFRGALFKDGRSCTSSTRIYGCRDEGEGGGARNARILGTEGQSFPPFLQRQRTR